MSNRAIQKLLEQQSKVKERTAPWMVANQLMDICHREPASAEIIAQDLENESMSIVEAEKKIKAFADKHKTGNFSCVTPSTGQDLVQEGNTLRHCVGGYGKDHCSGKPVFFVRKYRRPERSYYTLQINMTGSIPKEIQLHGYGNERHGPNKQFKHKLSSKVRAFCDRWESEVLQPWFAAQKKPERKQESGKKKGRPAA